MAYFDSIKIGGTIKQVQVVQELKALPSPVLETSPQLVKIGNDLYMRESKTGGAYGTYRFMLVPTNQQVHSVGFISNGQTFGEIIINASGEMTYNNTLVYSNGNWVNEAYKTIAIFGGNFTNALYNFLGNNAEKIIEGYFKYIKVSSDGGAGTTIIDITDLDEIPTQYQDAELLKTAILFDVDHLLRLTWIDDMYYYGNTDDFQYRYLSVDTNDFIIMRYDLQDIAKAPKIVDLNNFVPKTATQGTLERGALNVLQASNENYIVFNDEIFRLADKQHNAGYLVYSHNGHDTTGCFFQKCITITLSSRAWVLETQENQAKLTAGSNITIENNVISATGGGGTSDTAYVSNSTLYIEEGTTAGGGGSNVLEIDIEPSTLTNFPNLAPAMLFGAVHNTFIPENQAFNVETTEISINADIYNKVLNNDITAIRFRVENDGDVAVSQLYFLNVNYPSSAAGYTVKGFGSVFSATIVSASEIVNYQTLATINSIAENTLTIIVYAIRAQNA